jgi:hypothetical protein
MESDFEDLQYHAEFLGVFFYQVARSFHNSITEFVAFLEVREYILFLSWPKEQERAVRLTSCCCQYI